MTTTSAASRVHACAQDPSARGLPTQLVQAPIPRAGEGGPHDRAAAAQPGGCLSAADMETIDHLRRLFESCHFNQAALHSALGRDAAQPLSREEIPLLE